MSSGTKSSTSDLLPEAVYGLPELYASDIAKARLVANPGCYPTSIILGMTAALADGLIETHGIVADSKSGVSGAGRSAKLGSLYCEVADSFKAYGIGTHRHTPEIEQELSRLAHGPMTISFNPHLVPMNRGILSTIYAQLKAPLSQADAQRVYEETWADSPWVRVLPSGQLPETRNVRGTMSPDQPSHRGIRHRQRLPRRIRAGHRQRQHHVRASGHDRAHALRHDAVRPAGGNRSACDARKTRKLA